MILPMARPEAPILVVDDDPKIAALVRTYLEREHFPVVTAADGESAVRALEDAAPRLVVLDLMLPGIDGLAVIRRARTMGDTPILVLSARGSTGDRVLGLTEGADDYLIKPFAMAELIARIHAVLRRTRPRGSSIAVADLVINNDATQVRRGGDSLDLTDTERRLLGYLAAHRDRVVSKTQILTAVWGYDGFDENVVEVHVSSLRRKLEAGGRSRLVHTVRGRGYLLGITT